MNISYKQIEEYCNELHFVAKQIDETLQKVKNTRQKIEKTGCWEGPAANNYINKLKILESNFDNITNELENAILYVAKCSEGYQAIDKNVMKEICEKLHIAEPELNSSKYFQGDNNV